MVLVAILGCLVIIIAHNSKKPSLEAVSEPQEEASITESPALPIDQPAVAKEPRQPIVQPRIASRPTNNIFRSPPPRAAVLPSVVVVQPTIISPIEITPSSEFENATLPVPPGGVATAPLLDATRPAIHGRVTLIGAPPPEVPIDFGTVCGPIHPEGATTHHYLVSPEGGLANVFVYIQEGLEKMKFRPQEQSPVLDNINCFFEPYVMGVQAGQLFFVRNLDPVMHNIHATPTANKAINFAIALQGQAVQKSFAVPETSIRIKCDIHPWMFAYVHVVAHPYFAVSDREGVYQFPSNLPDGNYLLTALHPKAGPLRRRISVRSNEAKTVDFAFRVSPRLSGL